MIIKLPKSIETYFSTYNFPDQNAFISIFADDAIVVDDGHKYQGLAAINDWSEKCHFQAKLIQAFTDVTHIHNKIIITAKVTKNSNKSGLFDPILFDFHFTLKEDKITRLFILVAVRPADVSIEESTTTHQCSQVNNIDFTAATNRSMRVRKIYQQLEEQKHGSIWTTEEDMIGLVTDVGVLGRLVMANGGRWVHNGDVHADLSDKLAECLWWIFVLSHRLGTNVTESFNTLMDRLDTNT